MAAAELRVMALKALRGETHLRAGQGPDKLHVARRRGAWVVVGGESDGQASVDEATGRGKPHIKEEGRTRQTSGHGDGTTELLYAFSGSASKWSAESAP